MLKRRRRRKVGERHDDCEQEHRTRGTQGLGLVETMNATIITITLKTLFPDTARRAPTAPTQPLFNGLEPNTSSSLRGHLG